MRNTNLVWRDLLMTGIGVVFGTAGYVVNKKVIDKFKQHQNDVKQETMDSSYELEDHCYDPE